MTSHRTLDGVLPALVLAALLGACAGPTTVDPGPYRSSTRLPSTALVAQEPATAPARAPIGSRTLTALLAHEPVLVPRAGAGDRVVVRDWDLAIDDLRHAALTAEAEDGWVCAQRGARCLWKDIGVGEGATTASMRLRLPDPDLAGADALRFVHFHPVRRVLRSALIPLFRSLSRRGMSADEFWLTIEREEYLFRVPPSLTDFQADAQLRGKLPGVAVTSHVVTALALYTYTSTPRARRWLLAEPIAARAAWDEATRDLESLEQLLERLGRLGLTVEVRPLPGSDWDALRPWFDQELRDHPAGI